MEPDDICKHVNVYSLVKLHDKFDENAIVYIMPRAEIVTIILGDF